MNYFFFFVGLLSFLNSDAAINPIQNPSLFISSLTNANPATIQKMKDMVAELIVEGEDERASIIATHDAATARFDTAVSAQADASAANNVAAGNVKNADNIVNDLAKKESFASSKRAAALATLNAKTNDANTKADIRASEVKRLDGEKALLETVLEKLETLLPGVELIEGRLTIVDYIVGRSLLSQSNADRDAVKKIVDKINAMVGVGEGQRHTAIKNDKDAAAALVVATDANAAAIADHQAVAGQLGSAEAELARLTNILLVKTSELQDANDELSSATTDLANKKQIRETEEARLNSEKGTLEEVAAALDRLS